MAEVLRYHALRKKATSPLPETQLKCICQSKPNSFSQFKPTSDVTFISNIYIQIPELLFVVNSFQQQQSKCLTHLSLTFTFLILFVFLPHQLQFLSFSFSYTHLQNITEDNEYIIAAPNALFGSEFAFFKIHFD